MVFAIEFSDEARLDLLESRDYYSRLSKSVLSRFDNAIIEVIQRLEKNPQHFQKRYRNIKVVFTKKFPYSIHYIEEHKTVYIQRILHQKQFYK